MEFGPVQNRVVDIRGEERQVWMRRSRLDKRGKVNTHMKENVEKYERIRSKILFGKS